MTVDGEEIDPGQYASKPQDPDAEPETPGKDVADSLLPTALEAIGIDPGMSIADVLARAGD